MTYRMATVSPHSRIVAILATTKPAQLTHLLMVLALSAQPQSLAIPNGTTPFYQVIAARLMKLKGRRVSLKSALRLSRLRSVTEKSMKMRPMFATLLPSTDRSTWQLRQKLVPSPTLPKIHPQLHLDAVSLLRISQKTKWLAWKRLSNLRSLCSIQLPH